VRGASTAFTILLIGDIAAPLVGHFLAHTPLRLLGVWWLVLVSVIGYVVGGIRSAAAARPWLHGIAAAVLAWLLMLPIRLALTRLGDLDAIAVDVGIALAAGTVGGLLGAYRRSRHSGEA
jgi:hypothetical membrane protein